MIKAGITGSIGSGKSIICRVFEILGIPVYYSDIEAKKLYNTDGNVKQQMISVFGKDIYTNSGIDRLKLAGFIFNNPALLSKVNGIIHPEVASHFKSWCLLHSDFPYVVFESALLFESGQAQFVDTIITVTAPQTVRMDRILGRPGMTREQAEAVMRNQAGDETRIARSGHVIVNDGTQLVLPEVLRIHELLIN